MAKVNVKIAVVTESVKVFENAKEAAKAFEAAEAAVLVIISANLSDEIRKDLGLKYKPGKWPWYGKGGTVTFQGRAYWYGLDLSILTVEKGRVPSDSWERGFDALMRCGSW